MGLNCYAVHLSGLRVCVFVGAIRQPPAREWMMERWAEELNE